MGCETPRELYERLRIAFVCHSNVNRSMEAHALGMSAGYHCQSFGTGQKVRLPGLSQDSPNVFPFDSCTYEEMIRRLESQDKEGYTKSGLLNMLERDRSVKPFPQRWQEHKGHFDLIICFDQRVYDAVIEGLDEFLFRC